uniref:Uncharacterized protein n=1 Tax=Rhizophora mucronata TaxID=61149 RepID=A0A2P2MAX7_RHIMU
MKKENREEEHRTSRNNRSSLPIHSFQYYINHQFIDQEKHLTLPTELQ